MLPSVALAKRTSEVVALLVRFGFGEFVEQSGLARRLESQRGARNGAEPGPHTGPLSRRVRMLLEELGPTFVKVGQILSTRPDLVPAEWIEELEKLQSEVPPVPFEGKGGIAERLEAEYPDGELDKTFASIEETALAAGSMAQVHRARLRGEDADVVLKILRPGIREKVEGDLELMRTIGRLAQAAFENLGFEVDAVIDEFTRQLARETDLSVEARSTQRMRRDFEGREGVSFPRVFESASRRSVLVLEEIHGTLLSKLEPEGDNENETGDGAALALDEAARERLARRGADMVFHQCLEVGFFHADPHPGNIFVVDGERLVFIDCGMTGVVDPGTIQLLARIVHGVVRRELDEVVTAALWLADADSELAEDRAFRADAWQLIDRFQGGSLESFRIGELLNEFFALLRRYDLRCPADIVYLIKALTTIEGVAERIAPRFDLVAYVRPYVERLVRQRYGLRAVAERSKEAALAYGDLFEELPGQLSELFRAIRRKRVSLHLEHGGADRLTTQIERASMNISWSLAIASIVISGALLVLADSIRGEPSALTTIAIWAILLAMGSGFVRYWIAHRGRGSE